MRQPVDGTFLAVYTAVPVRLAALPDTLLSTYETNPGDLSPHPCIISPEIYIPRRRAPVRGEPRDIKITGLAVPIAPL